MTTVHLLATLGGTGGGDGTVTSVNGVNPVAGAVTLVKADVGLGNVDNTSDAAKALSDAAIAALALKAPLASPTFTGTVSGVTKAHVGLGNVDNTADTAKPVSTATQTALDAKAPIASPTFTGTPVAPTASLGTNTTQVATTAFTKAAIDALIAGAPGALDTLKEISDQLATDESAVSALVTTVGTKAPLASPTFTGTPVVPTAASGTNTTQAASTAFVRTAVTTLAIQETETVVVYRLYTSGAWQLLGTIPENAIVMWIGPVSVGLPPIGGGYARVGDLYSGTEG